MCQIDWDRLTELRSDIGEEDFADVALLFVSELEEHLDRLSAAPATATAGDFHFLRGSASNLGFVALATACSMAELACNSGSRPDIASVVLSFRAALSELAPTMPELAA